MSRLVFVLLLFLSAVASGQNQYWLDQSTSSDIIIEYKFDYSGTMDVNHGGMATMVIDFDRPVASTYESELGGYTFDVIGTVTKVIDGTFPAGLSSHGYAYSFDVGRLSRLDDDSFDPSGDFCIVAALIPADNTSTGYIMAKDNATTQRSWTLFQNAASLDMYVWKAGGTFSAHGRGATFVAHRPVFIIACFDFKTDGTSVIQMFVDDNTVSQKTNCVGPVRNMAAAATIGSYDGGGNYFTGDIQKLVYLDGELLDSDDRDFRYAQWQGRMSTSGNIARISSAAPPATYLDLDRQPFLVDMAPDSYQVGPNGIQTPFEVENYLNRSSVETWAGAGDITGWNDNTSAGNGTAVIAEENTIVAHQGASCKITLTGTTSETWQYSACITDGIASDLYCSIWAQGTGVNELGLKVYEFDDAGCTSALQNGYIVSPTDVTTSWDKYGDKFAAGSWHGSTASWRILIEEKGDNGVTTIWDAINCWSSATPSLSFCGNDVDASSVCTRVRPIARMPITAGAFEIELVARTEYAGDENVYYMQLLNWQVNGKGPILMLDRDVNGPSWQSIDGDLGLFTTYFTSWTANVDHTIIAQHDSDGDPFDLYVDGVLATNDSGVGTNLLTEFDTDPDIGGFDQSIRNIILRGNLTKP